MRYVRAYPAELPVLRDVLAEIQTPVQIIAGARDAAVPPVNAEYLDERLPNSRLDVVDAGHFTWEDAADEYAALVTSWWAGGYLGRVAGELTDANATSARNTRPHSKRPEGEPT
jgi:pimeloyl-ACP methyl ester carboxylesterase